MPVATITDLLHPDVCAFRFGDAFCLGDDLEHLDTVYRSGAAEAAVFYAGRALDGLARAAIRETGRRCADSVMLNLLSLQQLNLLPVAMGYWAHALRRMGNDVRHLRRRLEPNEADVALVFLECLLRWFFCELALRVRRLRTPTADGSTLRWSADGDLRHLLIRLEVSRDSAADLRALAGARPSALLRSPAIPAAAAEMLLACGDHGGAADLLTAGLSRFPYDIRLRQLQGLWASRTGDLDRARGLLEELAADEREHHDEETVGILAGVYKRLWQRDDDVARLQQAHQTYLAGWADSHGESTYLGVNAAATALWLGRRAQAEELAGAVLQAQQKRQRTLAGAWRGLTVPLSFWEEVTQAEAELIRGNLAEAGRLYQLAFSAHRGMEDSIRIARDQASLSIEKLGPNAVRQASFLAGS